MDEKQRQAVECELNREFKCVYCGKICKHRDAFGKLDCWYHPGELLVTEHFGDVDQLSKTHHAMWKSDGCRLSQTKWSCCGSKHHDSPTNNFIGIGGGVMKQNKNSIGCQPCDHQAVRYCKDKTPKVEHIPVCLINKCIFPLEGNRGPMVRVNNQYGIIDKTLSTVPITRFK